MRYGGQETHFLSLSTCLSISLSLLTAICQLAHAPRAVFVGAATAPTPASGSSGDGGSTEPQGSCKDTCSGKVAAPPSRARPARPDLCQRHSTRTSTSTCKYVSTLSPSCPFPQGIGPVGAKNCWCDPACEATGDCCADHRVHCSGGGAGQRSGSCVGNCGKKSSDEQGGWCWCEAACVKWGDCCADFEQVCGPPPAPVSTGKCAGHCGVKSTVGNLPSRSLALSRFLSLSLSIYI